MKKTYPRIGVKNKSAGRPCVVCRAKTTGKVHVQFSCMRGDDEVYPVCDTCQRMDNDCLLSRILDNSRPGAAREEAAKKVCNWKPEMGGEVWSGECGAVWKFNAAGPKENNMRYCPECGGQLEVSAAKKEEGK